MLSINTNFSSLIIQRSLSISTSKLNQAVERMSTGFKINRASDNAANYSIVTNMNTRIGAYQVAEDNVSMGLDLLTTASDSLELINDKLVRLRTLAEQTANGTYGEQSLKAINSEANALVDEIERNYTNTEYNGIKLFANKDDSISGVGGGSFIREINRRDTSSMTKLSSIDENIVLKSGTYSISTAEELAKLATMTNNGKVHVTCEFVLADNIDLSAYSTGEGWMPIGMGCEFTATFDGNGYVVSNLYIDNKYLNYQGLFGVIQNATVKNIGIEKAKLLGGIDHTGGLAGIIDGAAIENCYSTGELTAVDSWVGGLIGSTYRLCRINNCYSMCNVSGSSYNMCIGGLIGRTNDIAEINNCFATGNVTGQDSCLGGEIGLVSGEGYIQNSYSTGNVTSSGDSTFGGGFIGVFVDGTIDNSYSTGNVTGTGSNIGDFVGLYEGGTIVSTSGFINPKKESVPFEYELKTVNTQNNLQNTGLTFQVGINGSENSSITLDAGFNLNVSSLRGMGINNTDYLSQIDNMISTVSSKQTDYGTVQNRLESALDEIAAQYENLVSSRSTLQDADIAAVSSEYIRQQILQQASATLLATANQTPALALQLL